MKNFDKTVPTPAPARNSRLTAINFVADAINRSLDLYEIAGNALDAMGAITHMEVGAVYLWNDDERVLKLHSSHGLPVDLAQQLARMQRKNGELVDMTLTGQTQVIKDLTTIAAGDQLQVLTKTGFRSAILCPISAQGFVAGMLILGSTKNEQFDGEDVDVIEVVCNQLGNALIHAQLEAEARKSEEHYRLLVENSDDAIFIAGANMRPRYANSAFERVLGYRSDELATVDPYERIHAADVTMVRSAHEWLVKGKAIHNLEYRFCRKDGNWVVLQCSASMLGRVEGDATEFQFVIRDVSEAHRRQQQLIRRNSQLTALSTLAAVANSSLKLEDIARNTLQVALEGTGMETGSIHLFDPNRQQLRLYVHNGVPDGLLAHIRQLMAGKDGTLGEEVSVFTDGPMRQFGYKLFVVVPVKTRGKVLGVLGMVSPQEQQLGPDVIKMLTAMGHQLGSAVANAQLYEVQLRENEKLAALLDISGGDTQSLELESLFNRVLHQAAALLRADAAYIIRRGVQFEVVAATEPLSKLIGSQFPLTAGLAGQLQSYRQGRVFTREEVLRYDAGVLKEFNTLSVLMVPLMARDVSLGALGLVRRAGSADKFDSADLELMSAFAGRTAAAIDTAQLLQDLSQKNEQLELLIEEAHHRIKNNLQMVSGLLQLEALDNKAIAPAIARIQAIAKVHNLLSREMPDNVNARALITAVLDTVVSSAVQKPILLVEIGDVWLVPDQATALALIVNELSSNAMIHGKPPGVEPLRVSVRCQLDGSSIVFQIRDNGGGLPVGFDWRKSTRQGMTIIHQLARTNLRGQIELTNHDGGLVTELKFPNAVTDPTARA